MSHEVDHTVYPEPRHRWHPTYDSFREWLDNEAPPDATTDQQKQHNRPRYRRILKRVL